MRWSRREDWVTSRQIAHLAIVSVEDFERAQHTRAAGTRVRRSYLLRGLLQCGLCGRRMQGAWNNGRANYRCHHRCGGREDWPASVSIREDAITSHLGALLIRAIAERGQAVTAIASRTSRFPAVRRSRPRYAGGSALN